MEAADFNCIDIKEEEIINEEKVAAPEDAIPEDAIPEDVASPEEVASPEVVVEEVVVEEVAVEEVAASEEVKLYIEEIIKNDKEDLNIPKNIFLTHKSLAHINSQPKLVKCFNSWAQYKTQYKIHFFTDEMCHQFMKTHFPGKTYQAYCRLPMAVMKADLWRYCVLYIHGGIYSDADAECRVNPNIFTSAKSLLVCAPESDNIHLCQWCFAAPKNSPILKYIIDLSVKRILEIPQIKGEHVIHYLTGPGCFTAGIELYLKDNKQSVYENKLEYKKYRNNMMCVFNTTFFHKIIYHYFAGSDKNGWKQERYHKMM